MAIFPPRIKSWPVGSASLFLSAIIFYKVFLVRDLFLGDSGPPHPSKNTESDVSVQGVLEVNDVGVPR